jgi:sulfide:quinone oxidoreductase
MKIHLVRNFSTKVPIYSKVVILGAGDAGICTAKMLAHNSNIDFADIRIIDPSKTYWYQSLQTCVGGGILPNSFINVPNKWIIPRRTVKVDARAELVDPENNLVKCDDGNSYSYDALVIATGIQIRTDLVKGLDEALADENCPIGTNYIPKYAEKFNKYRSLYKGGMSIFTQPSGAIKCGGAPQKIMYLSCYNWVKNKITNKSYFITGCPKLFANDYYGEALAKVAEGYKVDVIINNDLIEVNSKDRKAIFKTTTGEIVEKNFDIMHVTPPQRAHPYIAESKLASANGYAEVDIHSLQHKKYPNIFSIGDAADLPTSKTASTLNEQSYILSKNMASYFNKQPLVEKYNGYTACPVFVGGRKIMLCEFGYDNVPMPTFVNDQRKPRYMFYFMKIFGFPPIYFLFGPAGIRENRQLLLKMKSFYNLGAKKLGFKK